MDTVREYLYSLQDKGYQSFQIKLCPTARPETVIGVRVPALRSYAKQMQKTGESEEFLQELPHRYYEEYLLHAFLISAEKDFSLAVSETDRLLPLIDNWAVCDSLQPRIFRTEHEKLLPNIVRWLDSEHEFTARFGIKMLMDYYLEDNFAPAYLDLAAAVKNPAFYVRMMSAWYFATALAKQYEAALPVIEQRRLDRWTHNKTIQKAVESFRIPDEHKEYLRTLRIR